MNIPKIAVIGLGRFGSTLARQLKSLGAQVLAVDLNAKFIEDIKDHVDIAVTLDSTDKVALESQELHEFDVVVVAIGENFEAALLTTVIAKQLNVPHVICRAQSQFHAEIFKQIGADQVIQPETEMGNQLARRLAHPYLADYIKLGEGYTMIELRAPKVFQQKTLSKIGLRKQYGVNLIAIKRPLPQAETVKDTSSANQGHTEKLIPVPNPDDMILEHDILVIVGPDDALAKLPRE